jgi:hypothetical protein
MKASQARRPARTRAPPWRRPPLHSGRALLGGTLLAAGCTIAPAAGTGGSPEPSALPPPGYGTLRQDEVTIQMMSGALEIQVTPLDESVTRVTAPDTYQRLSGMARGHQDRAPQGSQLFLVSFFSDQPGIRFVPEEVHLISRGIRMRPTAILPVTPGWGQNRLQQRQTEMAVYAFPGMIDLEADLVLAYELEESSSWSGILTRVQAERGRARARAGVGS